MARVEIDQSALRRSVLVDASQHLEQVGKDILQALPGGVPRADREAAWPPTVSPRSPRSATSHQRQYALRPPRLRWHAGRRRNPWMLRAIDRARI